MSFLIDPPWLYANGRALAKLAPEHGPELGAATVGAFWAVSISLYANRRWTRPIWKLCRARDGRDWMLNSGVFRFDGAQVVRLVAPAHRRPSRQPSQSHSG